MKATEEQISTFERDGVICLRGLLNSKEVAGLASSVEEQINDYGRSISGYDFESIAEQVWSEVDIVDVKTASRFDLTATKNRVLSDKLARPLQEERNDPSNKGMFFYDAAAWRKYDAVRRVAFDSALPEVIASLLRSQRLNFWEDTTFVKPPGTRQKTAFHQDKAYFQISGNQCVIVWIPLDPTSRSNGTLQYVRGSHLSGDIFAPNVLFAQTFATNAEGQRLPDIEANPDEYDIVSFETEPGDVIVHHVHTVHGADGNMSDSDRRAMSFRYCGDDIRYLNLKGAIQQMDMTHALKDGDALNTSDYPVVWPKPWPSLSLADVYQQHTPHPKK